MSLDFRFAIISDLHIARPGTVWNHPSRVHRVELGIPALEDTLERLDHLDLDFLLIPGDLTQHGEPENHQWLATRLARLPYPVYVIPGNHDVPTLHANAQSIGLQDFPHYYGDFGYQDRDQLYYTCEPLPGVRLVALNSNTFDHQGKQIGRLDATQFAWLREVLARDRPNLTLVMIHHNVIEHMPDQAEHPTGRRYILDNAPDLVNLLRAAGVQLVFTGHLHVQDVASHDGVYDITTGSLISYPHPYRVLQVQTDHRGDRWLDIQSHRVQSLPGWETLQATSREWMGKHSPPYLREFLTQPPLNLSSADANALLPSLRYFWADLASGDGLFDFPDFPPAVRRYFERFSARDSQGNPHPIDNHARIKLKSGVKTEK